MVGEKKDDGTGYPFKLLIEESLMQQRNEMMDSFVQILWRLPTGDTSSSNRGTTPFKVQINFDIPIFEGHIDTDVVDKWLNLLEGYFSVHNFSNKEKITFALLKAVPHVKDWWETFYEQKEIEEPSLFTVMTTWESFRMLLRNNTTLSEVMTTCIPNGPHCGKKETKQCQISQISSIPCAPSWVSKIQSDIWCSSITVLCIDTSRLKWNFLTSHPWVRPTDMLSKSSRSSNKRCDNLGLGTPHNKSQERWPQPINKGQRKDGQYQDNQSKPQAKKDTRKAKKDTGKWCDFHKSPWHNTVDCRSKKSLVAKVKASESDVDYDSEPEIERGR
jgi:hypothetical protein